MINLLRKNQRVLMLVIAVLTIVAFVLLYNTSQIDSLAHARNPVIYGKTLTPGQIDRQVKNFQLTLALGQYELLQKLGGGASDREQALNEFVWNLLVLQHQAREMGVQPTDDEVANRIKALPVFLTGGQFDPLKYQKFVSEQLAPRGFNERQLEEVMRDALRLERISAIVEAPISVSDAELREAAKILQPVNAVVLTVDPASMPTVPPVADQDVAAYFERNKAGLSAPETRAFRFVAFRLPADSKLDGKEKVEAVQKLADAAAKFADSVSQGGFEAAAGTAGLAIETVPPVARSGQLAPDAVKAPGGLALAEVAPGLAPTAFILPQAGATSDVVQVGDNFYVLEVTAVNPQRPLTLDEASGEIRARLEQVNRQRVLAQYAVDKRRIVKEAVAGGKNITDAAAAAGLKTENLNGIQPGADSVKPEQRAMLAATVGLREGEFSRVEEGPVGPFFIFLTSRGALDEKAFADRREEFRSGLLENKQRLLFAEWLRVARDAAQIRVPGARG